MNQSESIVKLAEALAKAQGVMEGAAKDSNNPFFKTKYADLSSVWDACRKPLSDNGLSVVQTADFLPEHPEMVCIETLLCHSSGEWIKGRLAVKPVKPDPQSVGSCITYLRRYSLQSMVGIAPEDDDGNAASGQGEQKTRESKKKAEPANPPPPNPNTESDVSEYPEFDGKPTDIPVTPEADEVLGIVENVESKDGETKGRPWTLFAVTVDGVKYKTFSDTFADMARSAKEAGQKVKIKYRDGEKGRSIALLTV